MAKVLRLSALPVVEQQADDTVLAFRSGEPVRIPAFTGGELPELATVATTGQYSDLEGKPLLGTASAMDASAFATAAQGAMAATALQPASIGVSVQGYSAILAATTASFTSEHKAKLDGVATGATKNATDAQLRDRSTHTGTQAISTIAELDTALGGKVDKAAGKGLSTNDYTTAEKSKLAGVETGAQVNAVPVDNLTTPDATKPLSANQGRAIKALIDDINALLQSDDSNLDELQEIVDFIKLNRAELDALGIDSIAGLRTALDGKQPLSTVLTNTTASFTSALNTKLAGIATGATANATDAQLRDRSTHTGTQAASTITGLATVATTGSYSDLTGKPNIPAGTVTSVGLSAPTGFSVSGSPVTGSGMLALTFASGYSLPTTAKQGQWDQAYGWGNHASAGYALSSSLATVATTGSYGDLSNKPTLGTAAAASTADFATAVQGAKADTALQPAAIGVTVQGYSAALNGTTASFTTALKNKLDGIAAGATANTGTVTSVQVAVPTGLQASGGPVTSSGTITISYASGYAIPTTAKQGQWDTAYGWGNHAAQGYATQTWVNAQLAGLGGDVKVWIATTGALTKNAFHKVAFTANRTLTLPASPAENDFVEIYANGGNATGSTIARNGQTIMGLAENLSLDAPITHIRFVYSGSTWRIAS